MYGLINKALEDYVRAHFGAGTWETILESSHVPVEVFVSMESYPDEWTYQLVSAASEVTGTPASDILEAFGEHWVRFTGREGYGPLLAACGRTLPEFLMGLDNLHARIGLAFGYARTPSFRTTELGPDLLRVEYYSERAGLAPMVIGLLRGLGSMFGVRVEIAQSRADAGHDEFLVRYSAN